MSLAVDGCVGRETLWRQPSWSQQVSPGHAYGAQSRGQAVRTWHVLACLCALALGLAWKSFPALTVESRECIASSGILQPHHHPPHHPPVLSVLLPAFCLWCSCRLPTTPRGSYCLKVSWQTSLPASLQHCYVCLPTLH